MEPDFSGYATKAGLKCSDGRTIMPDAFKHMDGVTVPLVWQHGHNDPENVLGHAVLEARADGVYAYGFFNESKSGTNAKTLVQHRDIQSLSIYANQLVEKTKQVFHGMIREVSLVLSGANPGAKIDFIAINHGDGIYESLTDEAIIFTGLEIELTHSSDEPSEDDESSEDDEDLEHAASADATVQDIYDTLNEEQRNIVNYLVGAALEQVTASVAQSDIDPPDEGDLHHEEGAGQMARNVFDQNGTKPEAPVLTHSDVKGIVEDARKLGSLRDAVEQYALKHGIDNIDVLFPDAKALSDTPEFNMRRTDWVRNVMQMTRKSPFSRVKSIVADLTLDEARAKGYVKGNMKNEEFFGVSRRTTTPTTVYKKQKLDRDDILDITDFDVVAWLKNEMRVMLEEEVARAALIGDGRVISDPDKIKDPIGAADGAGIRSIVNDHELYVTQVNVNVDDANSSYDEVVDELLDAMEYFKGTGTPDFYTTIRHLNGFLKIKDTTGRRIYPTKTDVAAALGVNDIITVEPMNDDPTLIGVIVNLVDYNFGTDRGGEVSFFDDFDIDYNQQKYLTETRLSGALVKVKSALVLRKTASAAVKLANPTEPGYVSSTGVVTIPTMANVTYKNAATNATIAAGAMAALAVDASITVKAVANSGYFFANSAEKSWTFHRRS